MLAFLLTVTLAAPGALAEIPAGTDLLVRVEAGRLSDDAREMWEEVEPLLAAWPPVKVLLDAASKRWGVAVTSLADRIGADFGRRDVVVTLAADLDASGGAVVSLIVHGAFPKGKRKSSIANDDEVEAFEVDGHPATRFLDADIAWTTLGKNTLVLGSTRGMQRQLRRLQGAGSKVDGTMATMAGRLRGKSPLMIAFSLPDPLRAGVERFLPRAGVLAARVRAGTMVVAGPRIELHLTADDDESREAVEHGARALVALFRATSSLIEAGGEAAVGLSIIGRPPPQLPASLDVEVLSELIKKWLKDATIGAKFRKRRGHAVEVIIEPSSYRALVGSTAMMIIAALPAPKISNSQMEAQLMLMALRRAELAHKKANGSFLSCGPVPAEIPVARVPWPKVSCFDQLGFRPPGRVGYQLDATVDAGELVLMARGDTDGDGIPETWILHEGARIIERFVPPPRP